ncbi:tRNA (adenosine(37)-N6)-threonylcarbamoyltransferase complex dimerization subunit type 1 TsaB [Roseateles oligotrophus]|uniref:tRNA (Adenosine(37)-N6)-threonylcarbamoyltransferase complex dimerization subunit type 1 TsaB n=1 Tax=Roseateles oligotrophus TaxID=1769250 RepID=A0ABT2YHT1_9BURK|nr:tRNA (adenosine(37)-N6)-threonylcarbamoyltransferase complex dimerization subunit type 1 TsaB [Roseateles oligotrophus]MCV2369541.1 tRNA (adenosine(37)-N6)-threonylcarbamoyltransferase complex dimerization subunit type 1 TsaB [Roseateles oligotrophus]
MTVLLSLDSSTETMALALTSPAGRWLFEAEGGPQASARLVPEALALLARAGLSLGAVDAIGFGCGPGAFTGLRAACAVTQGLAFGAAKPVLSIDSLMLVAEAARQQADTAGEPLYGSIWVAMDARMGEIYAAQYAWELGVWTVVSAPALYTPAALCNAWGLLPPTAVTGSALTVFAEQLAIGDAPACRVWPQSQSQSQGRAAALAVLAQQAWDAGAQMDAAEAMPIYIRDKVAQTTAERLAARAG